MATYRNKQDDTIIRGSEFKLNISMDVVDEYHMEDVDFLCTFKAGGGAGGHGDTDSNNNGHSWWIIAKGDDSDRTDNTKQQDCFNIYSVDTEKQLLRIFRVGSDVITGDEEVLEIMLSKLN